MRFTTARRYESSVQNFIPVTTLLLDCQHPLTYFGNPEAAEQTLRDNGGTISGNMSRCAECTRRWQTIVQENIQQVRREAGL